MNVVRKDKIITRIYEAPCGTLMLGSLDDQLCLCDWQVAGHSQRVRKRLERLLKAKFEEGSSQVVDCAVARLEEYFAGERQSFDVPLMLVGTDFQKTVWRALLNIPYGQTISYGEMARLIGKPKSVRALANANGANALSIFVPCHRVIGSDRLLTGYGGGLSTKEFLLKLES